MTSKPHVLNDRYTLVLPLGSGGQGSVWLGEDELLKRRVAIKQLISKEYGEQSSTVRERAIGEARAMARVRHRATVPIHDILFTGGDVTVGDPWLVMEFIEGKTLQEIISAPPPAPALDDMTIARIGLDVLDGLVAVHRAGVVHRDVKPDNILIAGDLATGVYSVFLVDFGIAKISGSRQVTEQNRIMGTPAYVAPERLVNGVAGPPADLWSLGATLYCAVDGEAPFRRHGEYATIATRQAIVHDEPLPPRRESALTGIIFRMLVKDPHQRADADEVRTKLAAIVRAAAARPGPTVPDASLSGDDGYLFPGERSRAGAGARAGVGAGSGVHTPPRYQAPARPSWPRPQPPEPAGAPSRGRMRVEDVRDLILKVGTDTGVAMLLSIPADDAAAILASCPNREGADLLSGIASAQPATGSAIMEMLNTQDAARLLEHLSNRVAAGILAGYAVALYKAMNSHRAATVLSCLKPASAAAVLRADTELRNAVWPFIPRPEREQIERYLRDQP